MLPFTKMHSLGNDFVMLDGVRTPLDLDAALVRQLADRNHGVGCDQLIVAQSAISDADFFMRIFNADGSESGQCGNGARCFGRFLIEQGLTECRELEIQTISTRIRLTVADGWQVTAQLAPPSFEPRDIPFNAPAVASDYPIVVGGETLRIGAVSMGNPHAVLIVDDIDAAGVDQLGPMLECHCDFPQRTNVGFAQVVDRQTLRLRVWERGVGETLACGSGACAAVAVCRLQERIDDTVCVTLPGGLLSVTWPGHGPISMNGPAVSVFDGQWPIF
tara:strand:- start:347 stop:1171 length:825 start_codon:yes stop_codon:yes gene_type:complete